MTTTELKDMMIDGKTQMIMEKLPWMLVRIDEFRTAAQTATDHANAGRFSTASQDFQALAQMAHKLAEDATAAAIRAGSAATAKTIFDQIERDAK